MTSFINKSLCDFRQGRSTITNLVLFSNFIHNNFSKRLQTDVIFTEAKAFDKVDHPTLLAKLNILGIKSTILNWISSYLSFRFQYVVINSTSYKFMVSYFSCPLLMICLKLLSIQSPFFLLMI